MGSVSQIGWQWYSRLAQQTSVTLLTHVRNRAALEAVGAPLLGSDVIYIDTEWLAGPLYRALSRLFPTSQHTVFLFSSIDYFVYDRAALRAASRRAAGGALWHVVHVPTPVSPLAATLLHRIGRPLVLGPWNGGLANPSAFPEIMRADAAWTYPLRRLGRLVMAVRQSTHHAAAILVANRSTRDTVPTRDRERCRFMIENAVDPDIFKPTVFPAPPSEDEPLRVIFVGRFVPFKGVTMLLEAAQRYRLRRPIRVTLVGDGPLRADLQQEVNARGLRDCVEFTGEQSPPAVADLLARAHLFCLPSVRESGGAVLLEAMACARPVVAVAYGGPAELVDEAVGRALPADGREAVVGGLVAAFDDLVRNPAAWAARGQAGLGRVLSRFTWDAKVREALALYQELLCR